MFLEYVVDSVIEKAINRIDTYRSYHENGSEVSPSEQQHKHTHTHTHTTAYRVSLEYSSSLPSHASVYSKPRHTALYKLLSSMMRHIYYAVLPISEQGLYLKREKPNIC